MVAPRGGPFGLPVAVLDSPVRWLGSPSPHHSPQLPDSPAGFLESARLSGGLRSAPFSSTRTEAILVTHSAISQRTPVRLTCRPAASCLTCCSDGLVQCTWKASGLAYTSYNMSVSASSFGTARVSRTSGCRARLSGSAGREPSGASGIHPVCLVPS